MNKSKSHLRVFPLVLLPLFLVGCIVPIPSGMPGMGMPGTAAPGMMGSAPAMGAGGAMSPRTMMPGMGMSNPDAATFANNVIKLRIGSSTPEDAVALLGSPSMKSRMGGNIDSWMYTLNTGGMPAVGYLYFKNGSLACVQVMKTGMDGGAIAADMIYTRGKVPTP
jgi:hypothetical protein